MKANEGRANTLAESYSFYCTRSQCKVNSGFAGQLRRNELETFDFSTNYVGPKGLAPVLEVVRNNSCLTELNLNNNWLEEKGAAMAAEAAARHPSLTALRLSNNPLHASAYRPLAYMLARNTNITVLELEGTEIPELKRNKLAELVLKNREHDTDLFRARNRVTAATLEGDAADPRVASLKGEWTAENTGGCLHSATWRQNTQYSLWPSRRGECVVSIRQCVEDARQHLIGVAVVQRNDAHSHQSVLNIQPSDIVGESPFEEAHACVSVTLNGKQRGVDYPYTLIPLTAGANKTGSYTLSVREMRSDTHGVCVDDAASTLFQLEEIKRVSDWQRSRVVRESWTEGSAGGGADYPTWRRNPQFLLTAKVKTQVHIVLAKGEEDEETDAAAGGDGACPRRIGMYVLSGDRQPRKRVAMTRDNTVAATGFCDAASVTLTVELPASEEGYVLVPALERPGMTGSFLISTFSEGEVTVRDLTAAEAEHPWHVAAHTGEWTESENGGCRVSNPRSWVHNPAFSVSPSAHCDFLAVLTLSSPPPHPAVSLAMYDKCAAFNEVRCVTRPACEDASAAVLELYCPHLPFSPAGYVVVPALAEAGVHGAAFTLTLYATRPLGGAAPTTVRRVAEDLEAERCKAEHAAARPERSLAAPDDAFKGETKGDGAGGDDPRMEEAARARDAIVDVYLRKGLQHLDREFPPSLASVALDPTSRQSREFPLCSWKRPQDYMLNASLFKGGAASGDVRVGMIEDAWLLGAAAMVATQPRLLQRLFVSVYPEYGFYQMRFCKGGTWLPVTIDDQLPVDASNELVFASSPRAEVLWPAVLEKAYAKLHGSYEALEVAGSLAQGLEDLTGGFAEAVPLTTPEGKARSRDELECAWATLQGALRTRHPVGLLLCPETGVRVREKQAMGILPGRAYPLLELREVRGKMLLRLRDPWGGGPDGWKGKWCDHSKQWTADMLETLMYEFGDDGTFWMAWDEVAYYFTEAHVCRVHGGEDKWKTVLLHGEWAAGRSDGGCAKHGGDRWAENDQYAVQFLGTKEELMEYDRVPLWVQVEQSDARLDAIKTVTPDRASFAYPCDMGMHLIESDSNARKLVALTSSEEVRTTSFCAGRGVGVEWHLKPFGAYTLIPCTATPGQAGKFLVRAACPVPVALKRIRVNLNVTVKGGWRGLTRGGAPNLFGTWRDNPVYHLSCAEATTLTIILRQTNEVDSTEARIGFVVVDANDVRRPLQLHDEHIVAQATPDNAAKVTARVTVEGLKRRGGLPYAIIPYTFYPRQDAYFTLEVVGNEKATVTRIDPSIDYDSLTHLGKWGVQAGTAGGYITYATWRQSPQYTLRFTERKAKVLVVLSKLLMKGMTADTLDIGIVVFKAGPLEGGVRQKVSAPEPSDIVAQTDFASKATYAELRLELPYSSHGYLVLPCTRYPYSEGSFQLSVYTDATVTVLPTPPDKAWAKTVLHGEWKPGTSAGGARDKHRTWGCNPHYRLTLRDPASVVLVLTQHPFLPGGARSSTAGGGQPGKKGFRPPAISDMSRNASIGMDLCKDDEDLTHITRSAFVYHTEVTLSQPVMAAGTYMIVPHTFESELASEYSLSMYTDARSVQLEKVERSGRYY